MGQIPFAYGLDVAGIHLAGDAEEQATFSGLRALRAGGWSSQRIAHELNRRGVPTKTATSSKT